MQIDIPVTIDTASMKPVPSMNIEPIMHEVRYALERLIKTGEPSMIDLRAMPLAPGEDDEIRELLGSGEVIINIEALGPSMLTETAYPGVWWIEHRNKDDVLTGLYIEIATIPSIVLPADEDIHEGVKQLIDHLDEKS